jgi:hypothetical protein
MPSKFTILFYSPRLVCNYIYLATSVRLGKDFCSYYSFLTRVIGSGSDAKWRRMVGIPATRWQLFRKLALQTDIEVWLQGPTADMVINLVTYNRLLADDWFKILLLSILIRKNVRLGLFIPNAKWCNVKAKGKGEDVLVHAMMAYMG